ncbi:hypothetical protein [Oceanobacillus bengalensis]|uniref:Uncharacterized protein n=1 Tax=Oceanobacillus bengalensis TaxID=1435466 RepID=A0A494YTH8_9BACI|nr:hypothetical protein [Oceanobacillus bengalensis]RKQ13400.1 hypothetical protein D8M05_16190 [Oceanobacillus bengalensis]
MLRKGLFIFIFSLVVTIAVACSNAEETKSEGNKEDTEETNEVSTPEDDGQQQAEEVVEETEVEEEPSIPEDEVLINVLEKNFETIMSQDEAGHMETIHSGSPSYEGTKDLFDQLSLYTLDITLSDVTVEEKSEEEARIAYTQTTVKVDGPAYENNKVTGVHVLRPEDGEWKIYGTEVIEIIYLDENGEELENGTASEEVVMEGEYADIITNLEMPFDSNKWVISNYQEIQGEAIVEFLVQGEDFQNFTELLTLHYYKDGKDSIGVDPLIKTMEENLVSMISGDFEFSRLEESEEEVLFEFFITGDHAQLDQEEVGRAFIKDNDLFVIRYTTMEKSIENKEDWIGKLKGVQ